MRCPSRGGVQAAALAFLSESGLTGFMDDYGCSLGTRGRLLALTGCSLGLEVGETAHHPCSMGPFSALAAVTQCQSGSQGCRLSPCWWEAGQRASAGGGHTGKRASATQTGAEASGQGWTLVP